MRLQPMPYKQEHCRKFCTTDRIWECQIHSVLDKTSATIHKLRICPSVFLCAPSNTISCGTILLVFGRPTTSIYCLFEEWSEE